MLQKKNNEQNHGAEIEESLIFEKSSSSNADIKPPLDNEENMAELGDLCRPHKALPAGLSEPEMIRHYVRLSQKNYSIDHGIFPLGSCTMKHNPRLNEKIARLAGFADIHPLQPQASVKGAVELMAQLANWLIVLTGTKAIALSPRAGAHGELCGMMAIRKAIQERGEWHQRRRVLVPQSAHGTNPATAALAGYTITVVPADDKGLVRLAEIEPHLGDDLAAIMLTNPNTCGLFESEALAIADAVHNAGGYFYCDGANFNAIAGKVRVGDLGIDAMHINLHKTFSTPHGGGGPGSGPVVFSERLAPFAPLPLVIEGKLIETQEEAEATNLGLKPSGRLTAFCGQMGMFVRALSYMISQGGNGIAQASEDAVLNANYILASLRDVFSLPFEGDNGHCMHELLFDDSFLKGTNIEVVDFAKAMIDEGVHPMTVYFPLVVSGAMLIEPTETESKASLDEFIAMMRKLAQKAKSKNGETDSSNYFKAAPQRASRTRLDETAAARKPILKWQENKT